MLRPPTSVLVVATLQSGQLASAINERYDILIKLPLEIVTEIFSLCLVDEDDNLKNELFTLGVVCKWWRHIVISTPCLWRRIFIPLTVKNLIDVTAMTKIWIKRARTLPLQIYIYTLDVEDWYAHMNHFTQLSDIVNASSEQWAILCLDLPTLLLEKFSGRPTKLRELVLSNHNINGGAFIDRFYRAASYSNRISNPLYHSLALKNVDGDESRKPAPTILRIDSILLSSVSASWCNLTDARLDDVNIADVLSLLREAPLLTNLRIAESRWRPFPNAGNFEPVSHEALRVMFLDVGDTLYLDTLLNIICLPGLERLRLRTLYPKLSPTTFVGFIERSTSHLKQLELENLCRVDNDDLILILKAVPRLTALRIAPDLDKSNSAFTIAPIFKLIADTSALVIPEEERQDSDFTDKRVFLPLLRAFEYVSRSPRDWKKFWPVVPDIFGVDKKIDTSSGQTVDPNLYRRPLKFLRLRYKPFRRYTYIPPPCFDTLTLARIGRLVKHGIQVEVISAHRILDEDSVGLGDGGSSDTESDDDDVWEDYLDSEEDRDSENNSSLTTNGMADGDESEEEQYRRICMDYYTLPEDAYCADLESEAE